MFDRSNADTEKTSLMTRLNLFSKSESLGRTIAKVLRISTMEFRVYSAAEYCANCMVKERTYRKSRYPSGKCVTNSQLYIKISS